MKIPELDNTALLNLPDEPEPLSGIAIGHPEKELGERVLRSDRIAVNYL